MFLRVVVYVCLFLATGRVARAGRSGVAYSMVANDEVKLYLFIVFMWSL